MQVFTEGDFIRQVKQYHPVAMQANITIEKAAATMLSAKGSFDPAIAFDASRKTLLRKTPGELDTKAIVAVQHIAHANDEYFRAVGAHGHSETWQIRGEIHVQSDHQPSVVVRFDQIGRAHV